MTDSTTWRVVDCEVGIRDAGTRIRSSGLRIQHLARDRRSGGLPESTAMTFRAARSAIAMRVSIVELPRCGDSTTFSNASRSGCTSARLVDVERGAGNQAVLQRPHERGLVHDGPARRVDQIRAALHPRERRLVDQMLRLRRQRAMQRDDVGGGQQAIERHGLAVGHRLGATRAAKWTTRMPKAGARAPPRGRCARSRRCRAACRADRSRA